MMNQVFIEGFVCNMTSGVSEGGIMWTRFSLGYRKNKDELGFLNCVAFNQEAVRLDKAHVKNGANLVITGRINSSNYEDKDGKKISSFGITVQDFTFLYKKRKQLQNVVKDEDLPEELKDAYDPTEQ